MNGIGNFDNSISNADIDYLANINAKNYLDGMKKLYETLEIKKWLRIIGIILLLSAIVLIITVIMYPQKSIELIFFAIAMVPLFAMIGAICIYLSGLNKGDVRSLIKQLEKEMNDGQYVTKKVIYGGTYDEQVIDRLNKRERKNYTDEFIPLKIHESRNQKQRYRYNGWRGHRAPFDYGMILEITYLPKSRVINSIRIVQQ